MRRVAFCLIFAMVAVLTPTLAAHAENEPTQQLGSIRCGYERWLVKTGQDKEASAVSMIPQKTTIAAMQALPSPLPNHTGKYPPQVNTRLPGESQEVSIQATIVEYRVEADSDIHVVVSDGVHTLITEIPNPACMGNSPWKSAVTITRRAFLKKTKYKVVPWTTGYGPPFKKVNTPSLITGVQFFDWPHGQNGATTNAVEIHPVLGISFP